MSETCHLRRVQFAHQQFDCSQLGLGSTMTIDTITIPTEVIFSKTASARTRSRCVDINTGACVRLTVFK